MDHAPQVARRGNNPPRGYVSGVRQFGGKHCRAGASACQPRPGRCGERAGRRPPHVVASRRGRHNGEGVRYLRPTITSNCAWREFAETFTYRTTWYYWDFDRLTLDFARKRAHSRMRAFEGTNVSWSMSRLACRLASGVGSRNSPPGIVAIPASPRCLWRLHGSRTLKADAVWRQVFILIGLF